MNPTGGGGSFPGIAELDRRYSEAQPKHTRGGIKRMKSKKSGMDLGRDRPLPVNPGSLPRQVLVGGGGGVQQNNVGIQRVNQPQIIRRANHHTSQEEDDSSRRNTQLLNTSEFGSQADSEISTSNMKNSVMSSNISKAHTDFCRLLRLCRLHIRQNPWHAYMCFQATIFTGGEVLLRKSVYTNLFHYRWFLTEIIAILTFTTFAVAALVRLGLWYREDRQLRLSSLSALPQSPPKFGSQQGKQGMKKSHSVSLLDEPLLTQEYEPEPAPIETEVGTLTWKEMFSIATLDTLHTFCCIPIGALPGPVTAVLPMGTPLIVTTCVQFISCQLIPLFPPMSCSQLGWILILIIGTWIFLFQAEHGIKLETEDTGALVVFILGLGVLAISQLYKKVVFSTKVVQMEEFNLLISPCQVLIGILFAPLGFAIQYIDMVNKEHESYSSIGPNFANGFKCLVGKNYHHLEDTCDKSYPGVQFLAYILCIIGSRVSFYYVLTWNNRGPKEAHVQLVGIVGTFLGTMLLYSDSVCNTLFGAAFEGAITDRLGDEWAITGLILIFVSVWMISLNADKVRPAKDFESLWLEQEDINKLKAQPLRKGRR